MKIMCAFATTNAMISVSQLHENDFSLRIKDDLQGGEKTGEASSGLYGARPRIHSRKRALPKNISISSCLYRSSLASILVLFLLLFLSPPIWRVNVAHSLHPHLDRLFVASVPKDYFQPDDIHTRYSDMPYEVIGNEIFVSRLYRNLFIEKAHFFILWFILFFYLLYKISVFQVHIWNIKMYN